MTPRLTSAILVNAMIRRVNHEGGSAMVLAKGHTEAGAILVLTLERGVNPRFFERGMGASGAVELIRSGPQAFENPMEITEYWQRRRSRDPDLWVIELDIPQAERFVAETILWG